MKTKLKRKLLQLALLALATYNPHPSTANAQNTVFTYQGQVLANGTPFTGAGQFELALVTSTNVSSQATATANMGGSSPHAFVNSFNLVTGGNGYVTAPAVTITGGGGSGASASTTIAGGVVNSISIINPGFGYTSPPTVSIAPPPADIVYTTFWSNDGTSSAGSKPAAAVSVAVTKGLFTMVLGDTTQPNMTVLPAALFMQPDLQLRIWFNDGINGFAVLSPLQNLTPTPFAIQALNATSASNLSGAVSAAQLSGFIGNGQLANSSITVSSGTGLSGGGEVALGGTTTLNNAGVLTVTAASPLGSSGGPNPQISLTGSLSLTNLPSAVLTNTETGVTLGGTFTGYVIGNGAGLTNVVAAAVAAPPGMALVPAGTFTMGDSLDGESDATPTTNITVSAFYMDINLVSYAQWQSVFFWATNHGYGFRNAGAGKAANHPVQKVEWNDSVKWSNARSEQGRLTPVYYTDAGFTQIYTNGEVAPYMNMAANGYRLPTEAEWEKAARGGLSGQRFPWGNVITENLANYTGATASYSFDLGPNGSNTAFTNGVDPNTSPVGYFAPNGYGLYDMAGNVAQWCWDFYGTPYGQPTSTNPTGSAIANFRVLRGGSWDGDTYYARCAGRYSYIPTIAGYSWGFRCVRGH